MSTTYKNQVHVNKAFWGISNQPEGFLQELNGENRPPSLQRNKGKVYDITGFDSRRVVALLSHIVNAGKPIWTPNKTFYFLIRSNNAEEVFKLQARPTKDQPGNGIFSLRKCSPKNYDQLCGAVKAGYENNGGTTKFAEDIKQLFQDNGKISIFKPATAEAYMLLLFEIARRLVREEKETDKKRELDKLPIGSAIARAVNLLSSNAITFEVFFFDQKYHCFKGNSQTRKTAIENRNKLHAEFFRTDEPVSEENCLAELQAMFVKRTNEEEDLRSMHDAYMVIGQFLLLKKEDFCQWLTAKGQEESPEERPEESPEERQEESQEERQEESPEESPEERQEESQEESPEESPEDCYNYLVHWWTNISPLNNRCIPQFTKHSKFVNQKIGENPVTTLAGIGDVNGTSLSDAGYEKAYQVLGKFLFMKKNEQDFKKWLKDTCTRSNRAHRKRCFDCLTQWCDNFLSRTLLEDIVKLTAAT